MRHILPIKRASQTGFTLIEMLIIAPIVILAIGGFVALMVNMVGEVLVTREESSLAFETQQALDRIEQDVRLSTQFLVTSGTLTSPQGSDDGAAAFSNASNALLLSSLATDKNPSDVSRGLIYIANQPNPCGGDQRYNRVLLTKVFYYVKSGSLWRRTVVPNWVLDPASTAGSETVCANVWQVNSCTPGYTNTTQCKTNDEKIMENVSALNIQYYADPGGTTALTTAEATTAGSINVTINSQKTVSGGNVVTDTGNVRVSKLNDIDTTQLPPAAPTVTAELADPNRAEFSWQSVPTATAYQVKYTVGSQAEITQTVDANTTSMVIEGNRGDTITFKVASFNNAGSSAYSTASQALPEWATFTLGPTSDPWVDYNTATYQTHGFTKTSAGVVVLRGIIKDGSTATDTVIGILPEGYRPSNRLTFVTSTYTSGGGASNSGTGRLSIWPDGKMVASEMNASWFTVDGVAFLADDPDQTWVQPGSLANGWTNYGGTWQPFRMGIDSVGRVHTQGTIVQGTIADTTTIYLPAANYRPQYYNIFSAKIDLGSGAYGSFGANSANGIVARSTDSAYLNATAIYWPNGVGTWTNLADTALSNGWVRYSTTYNPPGYIKGSDGMVSLRGLIKSGTNANGETIFTLPAGYRPAKTSIFVANRARSYGRIDVLSDGKVIVRYASPTWTSLDGINFMAEQ